MGVLIADPVGCRGVFVATRSSDDFGVGDVLLELTDLPVDLIDESILLVNVTLSRNHVFPRCVLVEVLGRGGDRAVRQQRDRQRGDE